MLYFGSCGIGANGWFANREDMTRVLDALARAVTIAVRDSMDRRPRNHPYRRYEVSCEATPKLPILPDYPVGIDRHERRPHVLPVEFVVDSVGQVDTTTLRAWPGSDQRFVRAARNALAAARFRPARRRGAPIAQIVDQVVTFEPDLGSDIPGRAAAGVDDSGWVTLTYREVHAPAVVREWYRPDSIEHWLDTLPVVVQQALLPIRPPQEPRHVVARLGGDRQTTIWVGFEGEDSTRIWRWWSVRGCGEFDAPINTLTKRGPGSGTWDRDTLIALSQMNAFSAAARLARKRTASPIPPGHQVRTITDVGCQTGISTDRAPISEDAIGPQVGYTGWSAEVFAGFVVDSSGRVDTTTIRTMPNADPLAVELLRPTLSRWRFRSATRGGIPVPQQTFLPVAFEPDLPAPTLVVALDSAYHARRAADSTRRLIPVFPPWILELADGPIHNDLRLGNINLPAEPLWTRSDIRAEVAPLQEQREVANAMGWPTLATNQLPDSVKDVRVFRGLLIGYPHDALRLVEQSGAVTGSWVRYWQRDPRPSAKRANEPAVRTSPDEFLLGLDSAIREDQRGRCGPFRVGEHAVACELRFTSKPDWAKVLAATEGARVWQLADGTSLPRRVIDGWGVWVEARHDSTYRAYYYNNPGAYALADARDALRLLTEVDSLEPLVAPGTRYQPFRGYYLNGRGVSDLVPCGGGERLRLDGDLSAIAALVGDSVWKRPDHATLLLYIEGGGVRSAAQGRPVGPRAQAASATPSLTADAITAVQEATPDRCTASR